MTYLMIGTILVLTAVHQHWPETATMNFSSSVMLS